MYYSQTFDMWRVFCDAYVIAIYIYIFAMQCTKVYCGTLMVYGKVRREVYQSNRLRET